MENNNIETITVTQFAQICYDNYKKFMNVENTDLPHINPVRAIEENKTVTSLAFVILDEILQPTVNLYLQPELPIENISLVESVLYHEFTHIIDANIICKRMKPNNMKAVMAIFSEYNAVQVQYALAVGFKNINQSMLINDTNKPCIDVIKGKKITISEDIKNLSDTLTKTISQNSFIYFPLNAYEFIGKYIEFEICAMYYLGKIDFCKKYTHLYSDTDPTAILGEFTDCVKKLHQDIITKNFRAMVADRQKLWGKFNVKFQCSDFGNLPKNINA